MKTIYLLLCMLPFLGHAQIKMSNKPDFIEMTEIRENGKFHSSLKYIPPKKGSRDTMYAIFFRNSEYTHITDVSSFNYKGPLNKLYNLFIKQLNATYDTKLFTTIGNKEICFYTQPTSLWVITVANRAYFKLTENQINKLFNKE